MVFNHSLKRLCHLFHKDIWLFSLFLASEAQESENLLVELGLVAVGTEVGEDLANFNPLPLDVVGVHIDLNPVNDLGVCELVFVDHPLVEHVAL